MTFVGFHIDQNGNLIDPDSRVIIQPNLMSDHLRTGLFIQKVDMETNYESWSKYEIYIYTCILGRTYSVERSIHLIEEH